MDNRVLVIVDMQNDFITGSLKNEQAKAIIPNIVKKINEWNGLVIATRDTHDCYGYLATNEGRHLPIEHCIFNTHGWEIQDDIQAAITNKAEYSVLNKDTFGSNKIAKEIGLRFFNPPTYIEIVGTCTDICVITNALLLKTAFPETEIVVDSSCCAGTSVANHNSAINVMEMCQIKVI